MTWIWISTIILAVGGWLLAAAQAVTIKRLEDNLHDIDTHLDDLWAETVHELSTDSGSGYLAAHRREDLERRKRALEQMMTKEGPTCPEQTNHSD